MKAFRTTLSSAAIAAIAASMFFSSTAIGATDPNKGKSVLAVDENAIAKLTPKQKLPKTVTQLTIIDHDLGDKASKGVDADNAVLVNYSGWLYDPAKPDGKGEMFDTSRTRPIPYGFFLGAGKVIKGWDRGVIGMKVKGKRTLIIPPALAYGDKERPKIPANSTLLFEIELMDIVGTRDKSASTAPASTQPAAATSTATTPPPPAVPPVPPRRLSPQDALPATPTELSFIDQAVGDGADAVNGTIVTVHYTGWLYDAAQPGGKGKKFDSSVDANRPFKFPLGGGRVIKGWDQGVVGMKVKGKRTLIIPSEFGYGARGAGGLIPPNSTLIFDVELLEVPPAQ